MREMTLRGRDNARKVSSVSRDPQALRSLINEVYWLALRMLWHPEDAERAAEAILLRAFDELEALPGEAQLRVRVLRDAVRYLLHAQPSPFERHAWTFDSLAEDLARGADELVPGSMLDSERRALVQELQIGCTQDMLLCLDREQRMVYLLGESPLDAATAAYLAGDSLKLFQDKLHGARDRLATFMQGHCGLLNPERPCRCGNRLGRALRTGRVDRRQLLFVLPTLPASSADAERPRANPAQVFREQQLRPAPAAILDRIWLLIRAKLAGKAVRRSAVASLRSSGIHPTEQARLPSGPCLSLTVSINARAPKARR